jgi:RNA polymerase sigma-70 factor, ECF subfamily
MAVLGRMAVWWECVNPGAAAGNMGSVEHESDAAVIAASLGEPPCFGMVFDRHATALHRYLVRRLGPDEAEGMVGEVFRIAFEKRHTYDLDRPTARPWLYGIATNLVAKHRRREARRIHAMARLVAQRVPPSDDAERVVVAVDAAERWQRVAEAVTSLPQPERDALVLHVWEALSYEEVADALCVPVGTVRSRLHRARGRLRELADPSGREPDEDTESRDPGRIGS